MEYVEFSNKPEVIQLRESYLYAYRWDIQEDVKHLREGDVTIFKAKEVLVKGVLTAASIKQAVLNSVWDKDTEAKYQNDFNAANLGILDSSFIDSYKEFLNKRKQLKDMVDADCKALGIPEK